LEKFEFETRRALGDAAYIEAEDALQRIFAPAHEMTMDDVEEAHRVLEAGHYDEAMHVLDAVDGTVSTSSTVEVTVKNTNHAPVADAVLAQTLSEGTVVTLDGSHSSDPDNDPLTYQWQQQTFGDDFPNEFADIHDGPVYDPVFGIYIGWRGESVHKGSVFTFYGRKRTAHTIGGIGGRW